jgi:hypothetical protein
MGYGDETLSFLLFRRENIDKIGLLQGKNAGQIGCSVGGECSGSLIISGSTVFMSNRKNWSRFCGQGETIERF